MHILLAATLGKGEISKRLKAVADLTIVDDSDALLPALAAADVLVCPDHYYSAKVAAAVRAGAEKLRCIQLLTAGYEHVQQHGVRAGITVCNAGDSFSPAVAAHAVALLLALQRRVPAMLANKARHAWDRSFAPMLITPASSVIAIVGLGSIGREVARLLKPFGPHIIGVSRRGAPHPLADEVLGPDNLAAVLQRADAIVLSLPLDAATQHLIGAKELAGCKRTAFLVNISRGAIVDSLALAEALQAGTIAGAALDVTEPEPLPADHPLWDAPNLIVSPHVAGACGPIGGQRLAQTVEDNLRRFLAGEPLRHVIAL
jgi:phosphoglycerate dehydrogenase-like enzyme